VEEEEGVLNRLQFWGNAICAIAQARRRMNLFEVKKETSVKASKGPGCERLYVWSTFPSRGKITR
jgi:hypothetical protein